jgi:hypothetical protein
MNKSIKINEVVMVDGKPLIKGNAGEMEFTAGLLQWGSKVLVKVDGDGLDRGIRVAIGHAAKKALRTLGIDLTPAPLKRPRKAPVETAPVTVDIKVPVSFEPASVEPLDLVVDPTPAVDTTKMTVPQLKSRAKSLGLRGYSDMNKAELLALLG